MQVLKSMLLAACAGTLLAASATAAPPQAVKAPTTTNKLLQRHRQVASPSTFKAVMRAPQAKYLNVASAAAESKLPVIIGGMLDSKQWESTVASSGLYEFPAREGEPFKFVRSGIFPNGGGVEADGVYYATEVEEGGEGITIIVRAYDTETWRNTRSYSPGDYSFIATDLAHDPMTGSIYGCLWDSSGSGYMFGTIDFIDGFTKKICTLENMWNCIAIDADGTIYAIDQEMVEIGANQYDCAKASLYKVDRETGAMTLIGDTGLKPYYASSAVIDHRTGRMFWSVTPKDDDQSALYEVDKATGACTLVYRYPAAEQFMGMYVPAPLAEDGAPAAATDLAANFDKGSLSGNVSFTVPVETYSGEKGSGDITYSLYVDGHLAVSGTTEWGKAERADLTLSKGGELEFTVALANAAGVSPKTKIKAFVGTDVPVAPEVKAAWEAGTMTVNWTVPQSSVNGGYIDPAAITYKVTRYPDNIVVAGASTTTSFTEAIAEPEEVVAYYYTVEAAYDRKISAPGTSNRVVLGATAAPYTIDFSQVEDLDDVTIINGNPDSRTWQLSGGALLLQDDKMMPKDDWVITAPVRILPGNVYAVKVRASSQGTRYEEKIAVYCGESNTAEAMAEQLVAPTTVATTTSTAYTEITGYVSTEKERTIFIGVHGCSPADVWNLRIASIAIEPAFATTAPGEPTAFSVTPDASGALKAEISVKAPAVDYDGNALTSLTSLKLYRDGEEIHSVASPATGAPINYTDADVTTGEHTYSAIAFNESGRGRETKTTVFVGIGVPQAPAQVDIEETEEDGKIALNWAPVTFDTKGYALNPELVSYVIYQPNAEGSGWEILADDVKETSYTHIAADKGQVFAVYAVAAKTASGVSQARYSDVIAAGTPFTLPYSESFAGGEIETLFNYTGKGGDWVICINNPEYLAQAEDNGFAKMDGEYYGSSASLVSGKIDLSGAVNPTLRFSTFNYYTAETGPDYNSMEIYVAEKGCGWELIKEIIVNDVADQNRWGAVSLDLNKYTGKTIQLLFLATNYSYDNTTLDQIRIDNGVDHNLSVSRISAPTNAAPGKSFKINVEVENTGIKDAGEFAVELYRNEELLQSQTVESLRSGRQVFLTYEDCFTPLVEDDMEYYAVAVYQPDMIKGDNSSARVTVRPILNALPRVTTLSGRLADGLAALSWDEPDTDSAAPDPVNENFESATSFATTGQCGWTFVDADGAPTQSADVVLGVLDLSDLNNYLYEPGIGDGSPLAWAVVDHNLSFGRVSTFEPHSGSKLLIALAAKDKQNDDWAISPKLYGGAQTVTFWAKSKEKDPTWGTEKFEILYSTNGIELTDFVKISSEEVCSTEWLPFTFQVPEGAQYFAIRCVSNDNYSLMIDDFSFIPAGAKADISLLGYNVYRDGAKANTEAVGDTFYTDSEAEEGEHSYVVTALYNKGESGASNSVLLQTTGICDGLTTGATIAVHGRTVTVSGAAGALVTIATPDGKVIVSQAAADEFRHTLPAAGVYLVGINSSTSKIAVR